MFNYEPGKMNQDNCHLRHLSKDFSIWHFQNNIYEAQNLCQPANIFNIVIYQKFSNFDFSEKAL